MHRLTAIPQCPPAPPATLHLSTSTLHSGSLQHPLLPSTSLPLHSTLAPSSTPCYPPPLYLYTPLWLPPAPPATLHLSTSTLHSGSLQHHPATLHLSTSTLHSGSLQHPLLPSTSLPLHSTLAPSSTPCYPPPLYLYTPLWLPPAPPATLHLSTSTLHSGSLQHPLLPSTSLPLHSTLAPSRSGSGGCVSP
ncbi:uncharacterized protein [Salvelinus alpinus]|uniref:uncharacterized protein n=1 Tax=Salvelinus alpinus TaxID=8036 RepID=UPI0039FD5DB0